VHVEVARYSRAGHAPEVDPDVEAVWSQGAACDLDRSEGHIHELVTLPRLEVVGLADVAKGRDHDVAAVVRVGVEDHERVRSAVEDPMALVVASLEALAEEAAITVIGRRDVLRAPRAPQPLHHRDGSTRRPSTSSRRPSTSSSTGTPRRSSPERRLTETVPVETSSSPTTSM
jgi:hypothetical protein